MLNVRKWTVSTKGAETGDEKYPKPSLEGEPQGY